ncbi:unnamed protein product [Discosporangium mesarthrocarpum]
MIFNSNLILTTEKTGGLFDFDGTLVVIVLQFVLFMFVLDFLLYTPLLTIIDERNNYVDTSIAKAKTIISDANSLNERYQNQTFKARKESQNDIARSQKFYKEILEKELKASQILIDEFIEKTTNELAETKKEILNSLDGEIDSLSGQIVTKILV